jgi:hypothetical protein
MEILILIGIFAFVVAILFRSNEALDRVGEVEKEVKVIEEEIGHKGESKEAVEVSVSNPTENGQALPQEPLAENPPAEMVETTFEAKPEPALSETDTTIPVSESGIQTANVSVQASTLPNSVDTPFPKKEDVHLG